MLFLHKKVGCFLFCPPEIFPFVFFWEKAIAQNSIKKTKEETIKIPPHQFLSTKNALHDPTNGGFSKWRMKHGDSGSCFLVPSSTTSRTPALRTSKSSSSASGENGGGWGGYGFVKWWKVGVVWCLAMGVLFLRVCFVAKSLYFFFGEWISSTKRNGEQSFQIEWSHFCNPTQLWIFSLFHWEIHSQMLDIPFAILHFLRVAVIKI